MIKIIGIAMLVASAIATGSVMACQVKERVEELLYLKKLMLIFKGELRYKNAMLSEAFMSVAMRAKAPYDSLFRELSEATEDNHSMTMSKVFEDKVDQVLGGNTFLNKEDVTRLKELGDTMGYQDQKMQLANIDLYVDRLSQTVDEEKEKMSETMKMYKTLGVMAGIMIAIVLI
ncbi:MAG: stage III sporulation protein AB [Lachnospiraceae bacterium]|nr:stage III sporulation protein AB [Lachnospiraceae bacterium]